MISFRLDGRSVVPPYLQIVQQVRQALRMGVLDVGDKLPTVREVVGTAIDPNTVLKAYRDLEREGLVEPGHLLPQRPRVPRVHHLPARRYWAFQGIETGIFVVLAAVLLAVTAIVVLRRDA